MDIATGLKHLHSVGLFHGNLRLVSLISLNRCSFILRCFEENIVVTDCGRACLTDAGLNTLALRAFSNSLEPVPSAWMYKAAEELLFGIRDQCTDVYSFASTVYAVSIPIL